MNERREWDESEKREKVKKMRENVFECPLDDRLTHHTQVFSVLTNVIPFFSFSSLLSLLFFLFLRLLLFLFISSEKETYTHRLIKESLLLDPLFPSTANEQIVTYTTSCV